MDMTFMLLVQLMSIRLGKNAFAFLVQLMSIRLGKNDPIPWQPHADEQYKGTTHDVFLNWWRLGWWRASINQKEKFDNRDSKSIVCTFEKPDS